ncbi:MAG: hypothetical protein V1716_02665 [Candidatus Uhrbacteria bacterium]
MQKIFSIFFLFALLIGAGCTNGEEDNLNETKTTGNYRKVSITGTVTTRHSGAMDPETSGLVACLATGTYEINLWFPKDGGQALKQDNKLSVAEVNCPNFGNARACTTSLADSAHELKSFEVSAELFPNAVKSSNDNNQSTADQLNFSASPLSNPPTTNVTIWCEGSTPSTISDYGSFYNQTIGPFAISTWSLTTKIGEEQLAPFSREEISTVGNQLSDVTYTIKEEWVVEL